MVEQKGKRDEFLKRKKKYEERPEDVAQRLANIYRQLYVMDEQATQKYNALLLETATDEILTALKSIPAGEEIREYYAFLKKSANKGENGDEDLDEDEEDEDEDNTTDEAYINANLPKAEELSPLWQSFGSVVATGTITAQPNIVVAQPSSVSANVSMPPQQPQQPVVKTVYVEKNVSLDSDKLKQDVTSLLNAYQERVMSSLKTIVIDSDIDKMHQNIKKAIDKVQQNSSTIYSELDDLLGKENYLVEDENEPVRKKTSSFKQLNKIKKQKHKYSVDMDEEDFS